MQSYHLVTWPMEHDVTIMMRTAAFVSTANVRCVCPSNRDLKHATVLSNGRKPEENILHARTVVSPRFLK